MSAAALMKYRRTAKDNSPFFPRSSSSVASDSAYTTLRFVLLPCQVSSVSVELLCTSDDQLTETSGEEGGSCATTSTSISSSFAALLFGWMAIGSSGSAGGDEGISDRSLSCSMASFAGLLCRFLLCSRRSTTGDDSAVEEGLAEAAELGGFADPTLGVTSDELEGVRGMEPVLGLLKKPVKVDCFLLVRLASARDSRFRRSCYAERVSSI